MHTNRISPARKIILGLAAAFTLALLAGCDAITLTNLTPASMPENPSQIYTFTLLIAKRANTVPATSIAPHVIVDGQNFDMKPSAIGEGLYEFEYQLPAGRDELAYYFLVTYSVEGNGTMTPGEAYTGVEHAKIVGLSGPAHVTLIGRLAATGIVGGRSYDAVIAACAEKSDARTLLTFNPRHFDPPPKGVAVIEPA